MTREELLAAVRAAATDGSWRDYLRHDPSERTFALLHRDDEHEIYAVCWMAGHDTGFHDHDGSEAAITVLEGQVIEERLGLGSVARGRYASGDELTVPPSAIHRVRHTGRAPATTVHAYSPPLRRMGRYSVAAGGLLERHPSPAGVPLEPVARAT